jgi:AcrR family transcriptional regulator
MAGTGASDTHERIMWATYRTLWRHGYAGVSIGRIAEEADLSKSSFYNHYDDKEALMLAFLRFMFEQYREQFEAEAGGDPETQLRSLVDVMLGESDEPPESVPDTPEGIPGPGPASGDGPGEAPGFGALVELRARAVSNDAYRAEFAGIDAAHRDSIAAIVRRGVEEGSFRAVDPDRIAEVLFTMLVGGIVRRTTAEGLDTEPLREELHAFVDRRLLPE